jgi:hypothetical protein
MGVESLVDSVVQSTAAPEVSIAAAVTTNIGAAASDFIRVTGSDTILSLGTVYQGPLFLRFMGTCTLAHSVSLICPGSTDLVMSAGSTCIATPKSTTTVSDGWVISAVVQAAGGGSVVAAAWGSSIKDFGAVGDGATDNTAATTAALLLDVPTYVQPGDYKTALDSSATPVNFWGAGRLKDSTTGNKRGSFLTSITAAPTALGNDDSILTAFNGDWSSNLFNIEHRISGAATLGTPASGYVYTNEATPLYLYMMNTSGHNQSLSANSGRTAAVAVRVKADQYGQGDCMAFNATSHIYSTKAGSTDVLANPAGVLIAGDCYSHVAGGYCNPVEIDLGDNGYDAAGAGAVFNLSRSVATGAKKAFWSGVRVQSTGTAAIDSAYYASGNMKVGVNLTAAVISGATLAAIAFKANNRIYFNATDSGTSYDSVGYGTEYISYSSSSSVLSIAVGDSPSLQIKSNQVLVQGANGFFVTPDGTNNKLFVDATYTRSKNTFICVPSGGADGAASITANTSGLYLGNQANSIGVELNGIVKFTGTSINASTVGAAGGASALPATPLTYLTVNINGTQYKVPCYNM